MGKHFSHTTQELVMQRDEMELLAVRATLWRMQIEILRVRYIALVSLNVVVASGLMWN